MCIAKYWFYWWYWCSIIKTFQFYNLLYHLNIIAYFGDVALHEKWYNYITRAVICFNKFTYLICCCDGAAIYWCSSSLHVCSWRNYKWKNSMKRNKIMGVNTVDSIF
jgi:hypothetical protein